jgi:PhoH-like ATPase
MAINYILDTNVLLFDPQAIHHFGAERVIIPLEVIEEIDSFKHDPSELGRSSRTVAQIVDGLRARGSLGEGVTLDSGGSLRVVCEPMSRKTIAPLLDNRPDNRVANSILSCAIGFTRDHPQQTTVVITKNVNLRVKADALGIEARDYDVAPARDTDMIRGWHVLDVDPVVVDQLKNGRSVTLPTLDACPNEYVFLRSREDVKHAHACRIARDGVQIHPLVDPTRTVCGIRALNLEQTFTLDALLDDEIKLVTLAGKAGTGKTLLAIAAGLHQVFGEDRYHRLLVFRPTMPVSRDLGYLPGDLDEKMRPWMQPVYDALELIRSQDRRSPTRTLPNDIMDCEEISIEPLTYIRGRSIPNQYIIIDEAQNLTPLEVKTAITRVGAGSKVVLTGDPHQIDNPYVDSRSNGLTCLVDKFRASPLAGHVTLVKGERSELAETAANLL